MSRKLKRPSSARRNIKLETFSPFVSGSRLRRVQSLLSDGHGDNPDALLCITGIDSRYNDGTSELINYLLFGFFDARKTELEKSGFDEEVIDDVVFLIRRYEIDIYCNPINYMYLMPYVSHWRNVRFHCMTDKQYEDEDTAGDFKVTSFMSMVQGCQKIGIPFNVAGHNQPFDKMMIEKWPLIQAFALEDFGGGGFFTLKYEVEDVSQKLQSVYNNMDPVSLEIILTENLPQFERQWNTMITTINLDMSADPRCLTEEKICEPLKSYFVHGLVGKTHLEKMKMEQELPFVLFGTNTRKSILDSVKAGSKTEKNHISSTGVADSPAKFMICHGVAPRCPLSCTRTYFLTDRFSNPFQTSSSQDESEDSETRCLVQVYSAMVDSVLEGIQVYASTLSIHKARAMAIEKLCELCSRIKSPILTKYLQRRSNIVFSLDAYNNIGCQCAVVDGQRSLMVKSMSLYLMDIPSVAQTAKPVGSIAFSEVFLDSVIKVQNEDGTQKLDSQVLILTENFPHYKAWHVNTGDESPLPALNEKLSNGLKETCGQLLMSGESVHIGTSRNLTRSPVEVQLHIYSHALIIVKPETGATVLDSKNVQSLNYYDGDSVDVVSVLIVELKVLGKSSVPSYLMSQENQIYIAFTPKTKAFKLMFSQVLRQWREDSNLPTVQRIDAIPQDYISIYDKLQNNFQTLSTQPVVTSFVQAVATLPNLKQFLSHLSASSISDVPMPAAIVPAMKLVQQMSDTDRSIKDENAGILPGHNSISDQIVVSIISGIHGSHQEALSDTITNLTKEKYKWTVLKQPINSIEPFVPKSLQKSLSSLTSSNRRKKSELNRTNHRVIVITPGCMDIVEVVQAIQCHPDPEVRQQIKIGAVTVCVDPLNTFMERKLTMPNLLNHCAQGWVNNIVFTSSTSIQNTQLSDIQILLRSINSNVAFFLAEKGVMTRSMDIDAVLSETSFMEEEKVRARHLHCPGWTLGHWKQRLDVANMNSILLKFNQPLVKNLLLKKLNALKSSLKGFPFHGNIYYVCGTLTFTDSTQQMTLNHITLSSSMSLQPAQDENQSNNAIANGDSYGMNRGDNFVKITGCALEEKKLKEWLRTCARQKPEKKKIITQKDLTKEDIKKIHKQHHLDPLPAGWFYNGTQFISFDGEKQDTHPSLEDFVKAHVEDKNKEIIDYNAKVDQAICGFVDLFS